MAGEPAQDGDSPLHFLFSGGATVACLAPAHETVPADCIGSADGRALLVALLGRWRHIRDECEKSAQELRLWILKRTD